MVPTENEKNAYAKFRREAKFEYYRILESGLERFSIGLLQLTITWYKIRHAGGQAHYYSPTGTLKQRDLNKSSLTCLCFNVPVGK